MRKRQLTDIESKVTCLIPRGIDRPIKIKELADLCGVPERNLYEVVNRLVTYGVPICSVRSTRETSGLFIPTTEQERQYGISALVSQVGDMRRRVDHVKSADLDSWPTLLIMSKEV